MIYNFECKDNKKKTTRLHANKTCSLVVLLSFRMEDRHRRNQDLAFQEVVGSSEQVVDKIE